MKKIFISIFTLLLSLVAISNVNLLHAESYEGMINVLDEKVQDLGYGIIHENIQAETKTDRPSGGYYGTGSNETDHPIDVNKFYSQHINILNVPSSKDIKIFSYTTTSNSKWSLVKTRNHIIDFEKNNPEYKVVAAVNGDFYDIQGTGNFPYQPTSAHAQMGDNLKTDTNRPVIGFKNDGSDNSLVYYNKDVVVNDVKYGRTSNPYLQFLDKNGNITYEVEVLKRNQYPDENGFSVFYGNYSSKTFYPRQVSDNTSDHFVINGTLFPNSDNDIFARGKLESDNLKEYNLVNGKFSVVSKNASLNNYIKNASEIRLQHKFTDDFEGVENVMGLHAPLIYNNNRYTYENNDAYYKTRAPRTMVGRKADGTIGFIVTDGRSENNYGVNQQEMMNILQSNGFVDGYNLDGGGSSTFIVRKGADFITCNTPSDGNERSVSNSILIAIKEPAIDYKLEAVSNNSAELSFEISALEGFEFDKLYVSLTDEKIEVKENKVIFSGLEANTIYSANLYFEKDAVYSKSINEVKFQTAKNKGTITGYESVVEDNNLFIKPLFDDPHNSINESYVIINGKSSYVSSKKGAKFDLLDLDKAKIEITINYNLLDLNGLQSETLLIKNYAPYYQFILDVAQLENKTYSDKDLINRAIIFFNSLSEEDKNKLDEYTMYIFNEMKEIVSIGDLITKLNTNFDKKEFKKIEALSERQKELLGEDMMKIYNQLIEKSSKSGCKTEKSVSFKDVMYTLVLLSSTLFVVIKIKK